MTDQQHEPAEGIRRLLDAATTDAPPAPSWPPVRHTDARPDHRAARWLAVAATVALIGAGVAVLARHGDDHRAVTPATDSASPVIDPGTAPTTPLDCQAVAVARYDGLGTVFTVVPNAQPFDVVVRVDRGTACTGGTIGVEVALTNRGSGDEQLPSPTLLLRGGAEWVLQAPLPAVTVHAGERKVLTTTANLPFIAPGAYQIYLDGFSASAAFTVAGPTAPVCPFECEPSTTTTVPDPNAAPPTCSNLSAVAGERHHESAYDWVAIILTNQSETPCRLRQAPSAIEQSDGTRAQSIIGTFQSPPAPLVDGIAEPLESFWFAVVLETCDTPLTPATWTLRWADTSAKLVAPALCTGNFRQVTRLGFAAPHTADGRWAPLPGCTLANLRVGAPAQGSGMGNAFTEVPLTNTGDTVCATPAPPHALEVIDPSGRHPAKSTTGNDSDYFGEREPAPTIMFPGDQIILPLSWGGASCTDQSYKVTAFVLILDIGEIHVDGLICEPVALDPPAIPIARPPG